MEAPAGLGIVTRGLGGAAIVGEGGVTLGGRAIQRHRLALLALLGVAPSHRLSRDKLIAFLWPETHTERGRSLLNDSAYVLRSALVEGALLSRGDDLLLNGEIVRVDVHEFEAALECGDSDAAVALYKGPFLDGFFVSGAPELERWANVQRDRLRRAWSKAVEEVAERAATRGDDAGAVDWWRLLAADDPTNSRIALRLMNTLAASGERAAAIRHAQIHATRLREDVGVEPHPDIEGLAEFLKAGGVAQTEASSQSMRTQPEGIHFVARDEAPREVSVLDRNASVPDSRQPCGTSGAGRQPRSRRLRCGIALGAVACVILASRQWFAGSTPSSASVAVLPFVSLGSDPNDDYFSDGMTEELIHALAGVDGLRVIARTSAFQFKGQNIDVREVGRRLGVASLLERSVRRGGNRLKITAQLVSSQDGTHLWSDVYENELEAALSLQEEIARSIVRALRQRLTGGRPLVASHSEDAEAYHLYLEARYAASRRTPAMLTQAIEYFEQAIRRDGDYAPAGRTRSPGANPNARAVLARLERDWGQTGFGQFAMAAIHVALGEREQALQRLEQVYRLRFAKVPHERQWSAFEPLYDDPEFLRIVHEAGFQ